MKVLTKDQAQAWLNQPEQEPITELHCLGNELLACYKIENVWHDVWFSVDCNGTLTRKKPWHWPKPDETTSFRARCYGRNSPEQEWRVLKFGGKNADGLCSENGFQWNHMVLANPDNLDEMPPMDLEV